MAKAKPDTQFLCSECGSSFSKWAGKCPDCGAWSSLQEVKIVSQTPSRGLGANLGSSKAISLKEITSRDTKRLSSSNKEFDRTLGGGFAPGSLILIGGDPGIGKSTLVLQTVATMSAAGVKALYVSGEESAVQVKLRSERLNVSGSELKLLCETNLKHILEEAEREKPEILVIDSIQTLYKTELPGTPGSLTQLRECTLDLMIFAKTANCITILIGHVTKDGQIAGPRLLEHMVDTVAYFEGDRNHQFRILRTIKNRFGATDEIGVFEMTHQGLEPVENPSRVFLNEDSLTSPGSVVSCSIEGSRAILFEVQALVNQTSYAVAQRVASGMDAKRLIIILALLEKFGGIQIGSSDVFTSIAGGIKVSDAGTDLALALAIAGNHLGIALPPQTLVIGELGLSGEVRPVSQLSLRLKEAIRLGFNEIIIPKGGKTEKVPSNVKITAVSRLSEAIKRLQDLR